MLGLMPTPQPPPRAGTMGVGLGAHAGKWYWSIGGLILCLPDLCLLATGRAASNGLQMKLVWRQTIGRLIDERLQGQFPVSF